MGKGAIIKKFYTGEGSNKNNETDQLLYQASLYENLSIGSKPIIQIKSHSINLLHDKVNELQEKYNLNKKNVIFTHYFSKFDYDILALDLRTGEVL